MIDWTWKEIELGNNIWFGCYCDEDVTISFQDNKIIAQYDPPRNKKVNIHLPLLINRGLFEGIKNENI